MIRRAAAVITLALFACSGGCAYSSKTQNGETWTLTIGSPFTVKLERQSHGTVAQETEAGVEIMMTKPPAQE